MILFLLYSLMIGIISYLIAIKHLGKTDKKTISVAFYYALFVNVILSIINYFIVNLWINVVIMMLSSCLFALTNKWLAPERLITPFIVSSFYCLGYLAYQGTTIVDNTGFLLLILVTITLLSILFVYWADYCCLANDWLFDYQGNWKEEIQIHWYIYAFTFIYWISTLACCALVKISDSSTYYVVITSQYIVFFACLIACSSLSKVESEKEIIVTQKNNSEEVSDYMNVIRSQRHDYNFHIQTLYSLIKQEKYDKCKEYVESVIKDSMDLNAIMPIKDEAIAALIRSFVIKAASRGIKLDVLVEDDLSKIATSSYETNKILGNLLQNAIDEVETHTDKSYGIHLSILKRGEFCLMHVTNKIQQNPQQDLLEVGYTSKKNHQGVGLNSVEMIVKKYNGTVYYRIEEDIMHFVASVPYRY